MGDRQDGYVPRIGASSLCPPFSCHNQKNRIAYFQNPTFVFLMFPPCTPRKNQPELLFCAHNCGQYPEINKDSRL